MVQRDEGTEKALAYIRHQAAKSLADLRVLAERTAADCGRCLEGIDDVQARFKPGDEWSVGDVLGHLIHATDHVILRPIREIAAGGTPPPFTPEDRTGPVTKPIRELRDEMGRLLKQTVALVGSLPEGASFHGTWAHPFLGSLGLRELIALHRLHVMDHVQQIETIKTHPRYPGGADALRR